MKRAIYPLMCTAIWLALGLDSPASALISVQPTVATVRDKPVTVEISNTGDRPEYVSINLLRILNPGVPFEHENLEPITGGAQPELYVTPFKLRLAPGQSKKINLKPLAPVRVEQVYRLDIKPVINLLTTDQQEIASNVVVNLAFSALVRYLPSDETSGLDIKCEVQGARFIASGNTRVYVEGVVVDDKPSEGFNVYPNVPLLVKGRAVSIPNRPSCLRAGD